MTATRSSISLAPTAPVQMPAEVVRVPLCLLLQVQSMQTKLMFAEQELSEAKKKATDKESKAADVGPPALLAMFLIVTQQLLCFAGLCTNVCCAHLLHLLHGSPALE